MSWVLTGGMRNLLNQINDAFPNRDRTSDGIIGDYAHTQEKSGHNPDDTTADNAEWDGDSDNIPEVRAIDIDSDLGNPFVTMQNLVDWINDLPGIGGVIRYDIYNRKIYRSSTGFDVETYTGSSAHTEHAHFSGAYSQTSDNNTTFDYRLKELVALMAFPIASQTDFNAAMDSWWLSRMESDAATSPVNNSRSYLRRAPWNLVVAPGVTMYSVLLAIYGAVAGDANNLDGVAAALSNLQSQMNEITSDPAETGFANPIVAAAEYAENNEPA